MKHAFGLALAVTTHALRPPTAPPAAPAAPTSTKTERWIDTVARVRVNAPRDDCYAAYRDRAEIFPVDPRGARGGAAPRLSADSPRPRRRRDPSRSAHAAKALAPFGRHLRRADELPVHLDLALALRRRRLGHVGLLRRVAPGPRRHGGHVLLGLLKAPLWRRRGPRGQRWIRARVSAAAREPFACLVALDGAQCA